MAMQNSAATIQTTLFITNSLHLFLFRENLRPSLTSAYNMNELTTDIHLSVTTAHPNKQKPLPLPLPSKSSCSPLLSLRVYCNHLSKHKSWEDGFQFLLDMMRRAARMIIFTGVYKQLTLKCFSRGGESVRIRGFLPSTPNERGVIMASQRRQHILLVEDDAVMHYCYFLSLFGASPSYPLILIARR